MDGDTFVDGDLNNLCEAMDRNKFDISSVKIIPTKRSTIIEHLQGVEYDIAMQARLIYPWLTSGAGMIARTQVMREIMKSHSLFFNGGDIEIGKLADMMEYRVGHVPMVFYTDIPATFMAWAKQRFSWMCGMFRHSIVNIDKNIHHPFHFLYFSFVIYLLFPVKFLEMLGHWHLLPLILAIYICLTYLANWKVRSRYMILFPLYALFQVMVLIWCGIYRYIVTVFRSGNIGRIRMTNNPNGVRILSLSYIKRYVANLSTIAVVLFFILLGTSETVQEAVFGRSINPMDLVINVSSDVSKFFGEQ